LARLTDQCESHLRARLESLSDDEHHFEAVSGCWSIRRHAQARSPTAARGREMTVGFELPEPDPPPFATIAWGLAHGLPPELRDHIR
jgi:hypothetical protein